MLSTNILMSLFTVVVAIDHGQHHDSHRMSHLVHLLRPNDNFFSELSKNTQRIVNGIFETFHLPQVFSKEPKIKVIIKMLYNLNDMSHKIFELYDVLRNASAVDVDNRPISQIRLNELIIGILNEEINVYNETEERSSEKTKSINTKESSEFANGKEFKKFIGEFLKKLKSLTVNDLFDKKENESEEYEFNQSDHTNLDIWDPSSEDIDNNMRNKKKESRRIFRGIKTSIFSYPFVVSIHILNEFMCAGSIISRDLVVTAASCLQIHYNNRFFRENPKTTYVRVGSDWTTRRGELIPVLEIFFHPQYDPKTLHHNIAVIRLLRNLHFQSHKKTKIRRILLDRGEGNLATNTDGIKILGWGSKMANQIVNEFQKLDYAVLDLYHVDECREIYSRGYVTENNFCAGFLTKGSGACNRDIGGPAIVNNLLVGIVSFGPPVCGAPNAPTVFTRVGHYIKWIKRIMSRRQIVYGVPTTSTRFDKFLKYYNTETPRTFPHMHPVNIVLTTSSLEPIIDGRRRAAHTEANTVHPETVNDINNRNDQTTYDVIKHDLYHNFRNMPKSGDIENNTEHPAHKI
ncbi:unnamed protein product [Arctia plantaginis]|uniref:Peptidase S1 domain-containing protein n=1 Tax=Arctia plantaginis TaxID=874455 RepID=A0A8S1AIN8_ARCPL|nr:unnamed protein product [Arctia plantaginis]